MIPDQIMGLTVGSSLIRVYIVYNPCEVHLNICSRRENQTTFSRHKILAG